MLFVSLIIGTVFLCIISCTWVPNGFNDCYLSISTTRCEKGLAAILIILHHLSQRIIIYSCFQIMNYIGFILVAIFFFISGYGLAYGVEKKTSYLNSFFLKRFLPVYCPYWIVNTVTIAFYLSKGKVFSMQEYLLSYIGYDRITGLWFVTSILIMYSVFWCVNSYVQKEKRDVCLAICIILYCIGAYALGAHSSYMASVSTFFLGVIWPKLDKYYRMWIRKHYYIKLCGATLIFDISFIGRLYLSTIGLDGVAVHIFLRNLVSAFFIFFIITLLQKIDFQSRILDILGKVSYELYIVHFVMLLFFSRLEDNLYICVVFFGSLLISFFLNWIDQKIIYEIQRMSPRNIINKTLRH